MSFSILLKKHPVSELPNYLLISLILCYCNPSGAGVLIGFDLGVNYENFETCDDVFASTTTLGEGASCKWFSPKDLFVLIGKGDNLVEIGRFWFFLLEVAVYVFTQGREDNPLQTIRYKSVLCYSVFILLPLNLIETCINQYILWI